jgi:hypothetical protein
MQRSDGQARLVLPGRRYTGTAPGLVQRVDDRVEKTAAFVAPARRVQRDRQLAVALGVDGRDARDEGGDVGAFVDPPRHRLLDRVTQAVRAVTEQGEEQRLS